MSEDDADINAGFDVPSDDYHHLLPVASEVFGFLQEIHQRCDEKYISKMLNEEKRPGDFYHRQSNELQEIEFRLLQVYFLTGDAGTCALEILALMAVFRFHWSEMFSGKPIGEDRCKEVAAKYGYIASNHGVELERLSGRLDTEMRLSPAEIPKPSQDAWLSVTAAARLFCGLLRRTEDNAFTNAKSQISKNCDKSIIASEGNGADRRVSRSSLMEFIIKQAMDPTEEEDEVPSNLDI